MSFFRNLFLVLLQENILKTLEFKPNFTKEQQKEVDTWMDTLKGVWNRGLALLEWRQYYFRWQESHSPSFYLKPVIEEVFQVKGKKIGKPYKSVSQFLLDLYVLYVKIGYYCLAVERWSKGAATEIIKVEKVETVEETGEEITVSYLMGREIPDAPEVAYGDIQPTVIRKLLDPSSKVWAMSCDIAAEFRVDKTKGWEVEGNKVLRPIVNLVPKHWTNQPLIDGYSAISVRKPFAKMRYNKLGDIPMVYVNDYIGLTLVTAWEAYLKGTRKRPRYKRRTDKVETIPSESFRGQCKLSPDSRRVKLPGLGWVVVPGIDKRLTNKLKKLAKDMLAHPEKHREILEPIMNNAKKPKTLEEAIEHVTTPSTFKICRAPNCYYLQIGVLYFPGRKVKKKGRKVGISLGARHLFKTNTGIEVEPLRAYQKIEGKIVKMQRQISAKKGRKFPPKIGSNNFKKRQKKISVLHQKAKRRRKAYNHFHSTVLVRLFDEFAVQDLSVKDLVAKPDPIISADKETYLPNNATVQSQINKGFLDAGVGQFKSMLEAKSKEHDRTITFVNPKTVKEMQEENATQNKAEAVLNASERIVENPQKPKKAKPKPASQRRKNKIKRETQEKAEPAMPD